MHKKPVELFNVQSQSYASLEEVTRQSDLPT